MMVGEICEPGFQMDDPDITRQGIYALILELRREQVLRIGRLGEQVFEPGIYIYVGSALGPGGLRARLMRHLRTADNKRAHWHIDALTASGRMLEIWWQAAAERMECEWAAAAAMHAYYRPPRFGASDCRCEGHLLQMKDARKAAQARGEIQKRMNNTVHRICLVDHHDLDG